MTQEEKQLLLQDLCARLPYGVVIETTWKEKGADENCDGTIGKLRGSQIEFFEEGEYSDIKPYLRPMSSMTEEEREEYWKFVEHRKILYDNGSYDGARNILRLDIPNRLSDFTDWLNAHHFDYRGLIHKGLALEAPEGMYKN